MTSAGLRETKKAATRLSLARAVLRLATHDGLANVTIDAVAAEAGVSVRTFHNYFPGKEEALVHFVAELFNAINSGIAARPLDESFWNAARFALTEVATNADAVDPAELLTLLRLVECDPAVIAHSQAVDLMGDIDARVVELIERRGLDPTSFYPQLVLHMSITAAKSALEFWATRTEDGTLVDRTLREVLDAAFDQVSSGMAQPISVVKEL